MGTFGTVASFILGISFMTFVAFFGRLPIFRHTPIAWIYKLIWIYIPNGILSLDRMLTGGRITSYTSRFFHFMWYDKHPTVLIFFILLLTVGEYFYLPTAWPLMAPIHKTLGPVAIALPYIFLYLSAFGDPGTITAHNHTREMARYPYDFSLFRPGVECATCLLLKPARSKHCSVCKKCIARADHHCIFINNCVGAGNQHWFVLLLLSTATLTMYGGVVGLGLIADRIRGSRYGGGMGWAMLPWNANGGQGMELRDWLIGWGYGIQGSGYVRLGGVTMLSLLTSPLVWGLLVYHIYLIYCGTTTNESMKWSDWQADMDDGCVFKRSLDPVGRVKDLSVEPEWTRWPVEPVQVMLRTNDGRPPRSASFELPGVGEWEQVWKLRDVENLYDIGFWDNLVDVFLPYYMFRDPHRQREIPEAVERGRPRGKRGGKRRGGR